MWGGVRKHESAGSGQRALNQIMSWVAMGECAVIQVCSGVLTMGRGPPGPRTQVLTPESTPSVALLRRSNSRTSGATPTDEGSYIRFETMLDTTVHDCGGPGMHPILSQEVSAWIHSHRSWILPRFKATTLLKLA